MNKKKKRNEELKAREEKTLKIMSYMADSVVKN